MTVEAPVIALLLGQAGAGANGPGGLFNMALIPLMLVIMYVVAIRPQQKRQREHQDWLARMQKGDEVVTTGGLVGKISGLTDQIVTLELQEKVRVRVLRSHIAGKVPAPGQPAPEPPK